MPDDAVQETLGNVEPVAMARGLGIATLIGIVSSRLGLWWGNGMSRVVR